MTPSKKIVLLYADTGGGHRSTAQAVQQALRQMYGTSYDLQLVNGTAFMPYPFNQAEIAHPFFVNRARLTYQAFWRVTNNYWHTATARRYIEWKGRGRISVLMMGGGDGMGRLIETALALANSTLPIRLVIVWSQQTVAAWLGGAGTTQLSPAHCAHHF